MGFGAGGLLGGLIYQRFGAVVLFRTAACVAAVGFVTVMILLRYQPVPLSSSVAVSTNVELVAMPSSTSKRLDASQHDELARDDDDVIMEDAKLLP